MPRLLIADDSPLVRTMIRAAAERHGWTIAEAGNARGAVQTFAELRPDAVILDLILPGPDELFALRRIRERDFTTPIVIATAWPGRAILAEAKRLGATSIYLKPFDADELARSLAPAKPVAVLPNLTSCVTFGNWIPCVGAPRI